MSDNNRGLHAPTLMGDDKAAEGSIGVALDFKNARQSLPDPDLHNDGSYPFQGKGDPDRMYDPSDGHLKDDDYPQGVPSPRLPGEVPMAPLGVKGEAVSFDSVAPYEYPEFPMDTGKTGASANPVPLT